MATGVLRKKNIAEALEMAETGKFKLRRELRAIDLFFLVIGITVGGGIFVLPGVMAAQHAGPAVTISFLIGAVVAIFTGLCYVEFASMVPVAGSAYTYSYLALGEIFAWVIGWNVLLEFTMVCSAVAVSWSGYVVELLKNIGLQIPAALTADIGHGGIVNVPAVLILLVVAYIVYGGISQTGKVNDILSVTKLLTVLFFIIIAIPFVKPINWHPFLPFGWKGVMTAASLGFFAYGGFDAVTTASEETKNPNRDIPIGLICGLVFVALLYTIVSLVLTGMVHYSQLDTPAPVAFALSYVGKRWGGGLVAAGAICGLFTVMMGTMLGSSRILFALSRDGLLPPVFSRVHVTRRTPYFSTLIVLAVAVLTAGFLPLGILVELVNIGMLTAYFLTSISILVMRVTQPDVKRPFKVPAVWFVAPVATIGVVALIFSLPKATLIRFAIWTIIGLIVYFGYGVKHSRLARETQSPVDVAM
ncbi:putative amino acid permease YhdG [Moorella thermoacetica]|uniref:amino acid permease n=1 Tax=Neomoorella thermoacetica TaxID=1525 RepID=UPI0030D215E4